MVPFSCKGIPCLLLLLLLMLSCFLLAEGAGHEEDERQETQQEGAAGRRRVSRRGREQENNEDNEIQRRRGKKKGGGRRRVTAAEVREVVNAALEEQLRPLHTALSLVRLDTFTEHVHRQLSTLEHIQGKLLTEYGELKAALGEVGKNTVEIVKQMAALEARLTALDRSFPTPRHPQENLVSRLDSEDYPQAPVSSEVTQVTQAVRDAVTSINNRLQATERRFKEDLATLENRTTQAMRKSHVDLDRRLATAGHDSVLILNTLDQLANKTCSGERRGTVNGQERRSASSSASLSRQQRTYLTGTKERSTQDELAYFPAENGVEKEASAGRSEGRRGVDEAGSWQVRGLQGRPITEVQTLNLGMVTRLASEIARQMTEEDTVSTQPRDCAAVAAAGETTSGVYTIYPASCTARFSVQVWCEVEEGGPSWTVIQRRGSKTSETPHPVVDFFRSWAEYKWGFGNLEGEYWLGLEYIHQLTQSGDYELRVDLQDWANETRWAKYEHFSLSNEDHNYTLSLGDYEGTAGNSLRYHQGAPFSTRDRDNDFNPRGHCARTFHGAWWFTACHESHLNGRYHHGRHKSYGDGINWMAFRGHNYSLKYSRMMIRRTNI